jgi:hypothetical protein
MSAALAITLALSQAACGPIDPPADGDTGALVCTDTVTVTCEDDEFDTGQMILHVGVPDWREEFYRVEVSLGRLDADPLVGELHPTDTPCGTLWEAEFRLFNVTCESIVTKEITRVSLLK